MLDVKSVNEVVHIINSNFSGYALENEVVSIEEAVGRIAAIELTAREDIPGFNRSAVDGYAVIASDTFGASEVLPAQLQRVGEVKMGEKPLFSLKTGETAYVPTGGEMPPNAEAMVMIEDTENFDDGFIYINKAAAPDHHVVFKGDDVKAGGSVIKAGVRLRPQDVGAIAALGYGSVPVKRRIRVGIISTGDEIVAIHEQPVGAQVRDINAYALHAGLIIYGAEPKRYGIVNDNFNNIKQVVEEALIHSDVVLISGGSSAGSRDETVKVIDALGTPGVLVHGIAVKPGKPTIIGKVNGKAVIGLPGHPASAYLIFNTFVGHLFKVLNNEPAEFTTGIRGEMACNYPSNTGREEYLPVKLEKVDGKLLVHPVFGKSGQITLLTSADGYVHIRRGSEGLNQGAEAEVILF